MIQDGDIMRKINTKRYQHSLYSRETLDPFGPWLG